MRYSDLIETQVSKSALRQEGYDVSEPLYHASMWEFDTFNGKSLTSPFLFTSPQRDFASHYGRVLYTCYGKQKPQLDITKRSKIVEQLAEDHVDIFIARSRLHDTVRQNLNKQTKKLSSRKRMEYYSAMGEVEESDEWKNFHRNFAIQYGINCILTGGMFGQDNLQTLVLTQCFEMGYRSVRMYDVKPTMSIVFANYTDVKIIDKTIRPSS